MEFVFDEVIDLEICSDEDLTSFDESHAGKPSSKEGAPMSPPKGYPKERSHYGDPTNYKYPLDTEKHVRAALSYFSKPENRKSYSKEEQSFIWARILRAAKKHGIQVEKKKIIAQEVSVSMSGKFEQAVEELKQVLKALAADKTKEPVKEEEEELRKLGDGHLLVPSLNSAIAKIEALGKEFSEKAESVSVLTEKVQSLEAKASEGEKAQKELAEIKAQAAFESRMKDLTSAGLAVSGEAAKLQEGRVKEMSDEQFSAYKQELASLKASLDETLKKAKEAEETKVAEAAKLKTEAEEKAKAEAEKTPGKADVSAAEDKMKAVAQANKATEVATDKLKLYSKLQ